MVKNLPAKQKMKVQSLGEEDPLEQEMIAHSSILAWEIAWSESLVELQSMVSQRAYLVPGRESTPSAMQETLV